MQDILHKNVEAGLTLKAGCGIGYEFSTLRPKGAYVAGAGATTSGPLSFMDIFDKMCFTISSAGGRRGAQMATFDVHHPDVSEFIRAKREAGRLRQFNLSLLITEDFIQAVKSDATWKLSFPLSTRDQERDPVSLDDREKVVWRRLDHLEGDYVRNEQGEAETALCGSLKVGEVAGIMTPEEFDAAVYDLVNFMTYMAEPQAEERKRIGVYVFLFLGVLLVFTWLLNREYWKDVH